MNQPQIIVRAESAGLPAPLVTPNTEMRADTLDLRALATTLRRRLPLFFLVFAAVLSGAAFVTMRQPNLYTATAEIVLNMRQEQITPIEKVAETTLTPADRADTEVEVLKSRNLADRVAQALNLDRDPSFNPGVGVAPKEQGWLDRLIRGERRPTPPPSPAELGRETIDRLKNALSVTRLGQTFAMEISITTVSPTNSARIANEYVRQYTQGQLRDKIDLGSVATRFLERRLEELRIQAQSDTARVQQYRIANNLLSTSGASLTEQEIATYNQAVSAARAQTSEDLARLNTAREQLFKGSNGEDVGEALGSAVVSGLRARQAEVSGRLATLRNRYGALHPDVRRTASELDDINQQIHAEIGRVISNLDARTRVSSQRLHSISESLGKARNTLAQNNAAMTGLDDLQRRAQSSQSLYESYLNRYKEAVAEGGTERPDASVVSRASVPLAPTSPRPKLNMLLGGVLGIGAGLAAAFLAEMTFSGFTTGREVEQKLGLAYLGAIPMLSGPRSKVRGTGETVVAAPRSSFAESFRSLLTSLRQICAGTPRVLLVTSALPQEGKTTISICLARTIARQGERVLLIDADYSQAQASDRLVSADAEFGLLNVLNGDVELDDALVQDSVTELDILPMRARPFDAADLLTGPAMGSLIDSLRDRYSCIVVDTAPVLPVATTRELAIMADAIAFVVRWRHTPDDATNAALHLLRSQRGRIAGVILSRVDMRRQIRIGRGDPSFYFPRFKKYYSL
ncbi:AAA family ATPase [Sphingomonas sp. BIUV-7]|uniref:non-specific protein-tyrosine kinase n=1 Tax=Sphingomonas natans TaxID=3063330 RepID=A0ABT8YCW2_9SPHN|nr:AAA family ATPase [Sphingomonas sp. BIUV-7]MDO6416168.1 AAA family ATPase [Sphingomonas sp. BIUV-7]